MRPQDNTIKREFWVMVRRSHPSSMFPRGRKQLLYPRPLIESLNNELEVCQFYNAGITVNGECINFKLVKMLRIKLALTQYRESQRLWDNWLAI